MGTVRLCGVDDLEIGAVKRFEVDEVAICLARCAAGYFAVSDICSHEDYALSDGEVDVDACEIECWKHGSMFSLITGEPQTLPATRPVVVFPITIEDASVWVTLP